MILFCEDCGKKNDLDSATFLGGKAVFQCFVCGYPNAYNINWPERKSHDEPAGLFEVVESSQGLIGFFLYHAKRGVVRHKMPSILTQGDIDTLGAGLVKSFAEGQLSCPDLMKMTVMISDKYFLVFKVDNLLHAVVITAGPCLPVNVIERIASLEKRICKMSIAEVFSHVSRINGVGGYILLDKSDNIITHSVEIKAPEKLSKMVCSCGRSLSSVGKKHFKYGFFLRRQNRDILIFTVGTYYLGLVKHADNRTFETAATVMEFLNVLAKCKPSDWIGTSFRNAD